MTLHATVSDIAYPLSIATIVALTVWSIVFMFTKKPEQGHLTEVHSVIGALYGATVLVLVVNLLHKHGK